MMIAILLMLALVALAAAVAMQDSPAPPLRTLADPTESDDIESPSELALRDPVEALLRYGTPADAPRLADQGQDLSALGYRPPHE